MLKQTLRLAHPVFASALEGVGVALTPVSRTNQRTWTGLLRQTGGGHVVHERSAFRCCPHALLTCRRGLVCASTGLLRHRGASRPPPRRSASTSTRMKQARAKKAPKVSLASGTLKPQKTKMTTAAKSGKRKRTNRSAHPRRPRRSISNILSKQMEAFLQAEGEAQRPARSASAPGRKTSVDPSTAQLLDFSQDSSKIARKTRFTLKSMTSSSARREAEKIDFKLLDYVADNFVHRDVLEQPWHTMNTITDEELSSLRAHDLMFMYDSGANSLARLTIIRDMEAALFSELRGKVLYVRLVDLGDTQLAAHGHRSRVTEEAGGTVESEKEGHEDDGRTGQRSSRHVDPIPPRNEVALVRQVTAAIEAVLRHYTVNVIKPFHMEVGCDVSHYADAVPLLSAAKVNVAQFVEDATCLMEQKPFAATGNDVYPSKAQLQPLSADTVALKVAHRIRRDVFGIRSDTDEGALVRKPLAPHLDKRFSVCIGVADRLVLAKMACDAEVAALRLQQRRSGLSSSSKTNDTEHGVVRVRSFYEAIRTVKDAKEFVAPFRLHHVPTFSPALVRILRDVFRIDKVGDIYPMRERIFFSLSKETFRHAYAAAFGCMRFPEEQTTPLLCQPNMDAIREVLMPLATNKIALLTPSRTSLCAHGSTLHRRFEARSARRLGSMDHTLAYGRLFTEAQFIQVAERVAVTLVKRLVRKGYEAGGFRVALRRGYVATIVRTVLLEEPTNDIEVVLPAIRQVAKTLARHRQKKGSVETSGEAFHINIGLLKVRLCEMNPPGVHKEIQRVIDQYRTTCATLHADLTYRTVIRASRSGRYRVPKSKRGEPTEAADEEDAQGYRSSANADEEQQKGEGDEEEDDSDADSSEEGDEAADEGDEEESEEGEENNAGQDEQEADPSTRFSLPSPPQSSQQAKVKKQVALHHIVV